MRLTAEIRWFWEAAPPADFQEWFTGAGPNWVAVADCQTRTDEYLRDNSQSVLGIKKRGELDRVEDDLAATVAVVAGRNPPMLPRGEASSYPRWLASLRQ